jgi:hypothetical protein
MAPPVLFISGPSSLFTFEIVEGEHRLFNGKTLQPFFKVKSVLVTQALPGGNIQVSDFS